MTTLLVRVGIDAESGKWNAPVNPETNEFVYVPIPEDEQAQHGYATSYAEFDDACRRFGAKLPPKLTRRSSHLDPDFANLTYGDSPPKARQTRELKKGDNIAFFAGLRLATPPPNNKLVCAMIGLFVVEHVLHATDVPRQDWHKNAHTRRVPNKSDVIVFGRPGVSGRLDRCIPIGEARTGAGLRPVQRVYPELLEEWGGLSAKDGYIQRSGVFPQVLDERAFLGWFARQRRKLLKKNN